MEFEAQRMAAAHTSLEEAKRQARLAIGRIGGRLGKPDLWVCSALETLADVLLDSGAAGAAAPSRFQRQIARLRETCACIEAWSADQHDENQSAFACMICEVAEFSLAIASITLHEARALTADMPALLRTWAFNPSSVTAIAARPSWLLDGWEQICLIWSFAHDDLARRAALVEIASLVPVLPREISDWTGIILPSDIAERRRRLVPMNEDRRSGAALLDLIARNEHFRAVAC